jgi:hypothetical protein
MSFNAVYDLAVKLKIAGVKVWAGIIWLKMWANGALA